MSRASAGCAVAWFGSLAALAVAACNRVPEGDARSSTHTATESAPTRSSSAPLGSTTASETASSVAHGAGTESERVACPLGPDGASFIDCNPQPTQTDYPECYTYTLRPAPDAAPAGRCIPEHVVVEISGYPALLETARAKATPRPGDASNDGEVLLTLERVEGSLMGGGQPFPFPKKAGSPLGRLALKGGAIHELRIAAGMAHYGQTPLRASAP